MLVERLQKSKEESKRDALSSSKQFKRQPSNSREGKGLGARTSRRSRQRVEAAFALSLSGEKDDHASLFG